MSFIKRMKIDIILISAVLVGLGVVVLLKPGTTGDVICYVLAGAAIAVGVCFLIDYLKKEALVDEQRYVLAISLTAVMVGVALFLRHDEVVTFMPTALSFLILFSGAVKLQNSWDMKRLACPQHLGGACDYRIDWHGVRLRPHDEVGRQRR